MKKLIFLLIAIVITISACKESTQENKYNPSTDGIVGEWYSSRANVAPLLVSLKIDSVYATFYENNTYKVFAFSSGAGTTMTGTYTQTKSTTGSIWKIVLNQSTPTALTSEGIFEVSGTDPNYTMKYEVAQTQPSIGATAPTAEGGFGSTNGGKLGTINIQKYIKVKK